MATGDIKGVKQNSGGVFDEILLNGEFAPQINMLGSGQWVTNTAYSVGNLVFIEDYYTYYYYCVTAHTSTGVSPTDLDSAYWKQFAQVPWESLPLYDLNSSVAWETATGYEFGNIVTATVGGVLTYYLCTNPHTSTGATIDEYDLGSWSCVAFAGGSGEVTYLDMDTCAAWVTATSYVIGSLVTTIDELQNTNYWFCLTEHTSTGTDLEDNDRANWMKWTQKTYRPMPYYNMNDATAWVTATAYSMYDLVTASLSGTSYYFLSLTNHTSYGATIDEYDTEQWIRVASVGGGLSEESDPVVGAVDGMVKADGAGGISAAVPGVDYMPSFDVYLALFGVDIEWVTNHSYVVGDMISLIDVPMTLFYVCIVDHTSGTTFMDDYGLGYWRGFFFSVDILNNIFGNSWIYVQTMSRIFLPSDGQINLIVPTTNGHATGNVVVDFNCGYTSSAIGDLVYLDSGSTWQKADKGTSVATYGGFLGIALEVKTSGLALKVALPGTFVYCTAFPTLTIGAPVYMDDAGAIVVAQPTEADHAIRVIGYAVHADKIYFNPSSDYIIHT